MRPVGESAENGDASGQHFRESVPRSAYLHVPFCRHRCGYCNFSVIADRDDLQDRFLNAIDAEIVRSLRDFDGAFQLRTLFIGGGTPTHLRPAALDRFLSSLQDRWTLAPDYEWSVEANPEDLDEATLRILADQGVNRISLGVQSFDGDKLNVLERGHQGQSARQAITRAAEAIGNVSIDLIFGAPGETLSVWERDLDAALSLPIQHISTYALTFEKGTSFWSRRNRGVLAGVDEGEELAMYDLAREMISSAGLSHYEISNFARTGKRCSHNLAYWRGDPWLAYGPGAASYTRGFRRVNHRSTTSYIKRIENGQSPVAESESIGTIQAARECAAFGVRLIDGIDLAAIRDRFDTDIEAICRSEIDGLLSQGLIQQSGSSICLSERGIHFADTVAAEFLGFAD